MKLYLTRLNIGFWPANIVISSVVWAALNPSISTVKDWSYYLIYIGLHIRWTHACPPKPEPFAPWFSSIYIYIHIPNLFIYLLVYTYISYTNIYTGKKIPIQVSGIFPYIRPTFNEKRLPTPLLSRLQVILHEITDRTLGESIVPTARATSTLQVSIEVPCFAPTASHIDNAAAGWWRGEWEWDGGIVL